MPSVRIESGEGQFAELRARWQDLVSHSNTATPFQTWEWQSLWWKHFGGIKKPIFLVIEEGKDLIALWPLMRSRAVWRKLRPMGVGPSDYLHPLIQTGAEQRISRLIWEALGEVKGIDLIDIHQLRETNALAQIASQDLDVQILEQSKCLVLDLPETFDAYLSMLGKSLRYDVRRLEKSLFQSGKATVETAKVDQVEDSMNIFFHQHRKRWHRRGLPGAFLGRSVAFHTEWTRVAAERGWLRLSTLRLDNQPVGSIYAMALGKTSYYYQAGFDSAHRAISPGTLLVAHTIQRAINDGQTAFDFMRGDEGYKLRWKPQRTVKNLRIVIGGCSQMGRLGSRWTMKENQVEQRVRARLEGRDALKP